MEQIELKVSRREALGKKVRFLRREGIVPANLYGHGIASIPLQVNAKQLKQVLSRAGKTDLITLNIADLKTPKKVLVREVQENPLTDELVHVDFYQVKMTEKIKAEVPFVFIGEAPVLKHNRSASLLRLVDYLLVEALPDALPHSLEVDLSVLEAVDQAIYVKDISLDERVDLLGDPEQMIVKVTEPRRAAEEEVVRGEAKEEVSEETAEVEAEG